MGEKGEKTADGNASFSVGTILNLRWRTYLLTYVLTYLLRTYLGLVHRGNQCGTLRSTKVDPGLSSLRMHTPSMQYLNPEKERGGVLL